MSLPSELAPIDGDRQFAPCVGTRYPCYKAGTGVADILLERAQVVRYVYAIFEGKEQLFVATTDAALERVARWYGRWQPDKFSQPDILFLFYRRRPYRGIRARSLRPRMPGHFIPVGRDTVVRTTRVRADVEDLRQGLPMTIEMEDDKGYFRPAAPGDTVYGTLISYGGITGPATSVDVVLNAAAATSVKS